MLFMEYFFNGSAFNLFGSVLMGPYKIKYIDLLVANYLYKRRALIK